mgnify:CR=1 FL=1
MSTSLPLAITQGDPAGIGPEIVAKAFRDAPRDMRGCFVVGDLATLRADPVQGAIDILTPLNAALQLLAQMNAPVIAQSGTASSGPSRTTAYSPSRATSENDRRGRFIGQFSVDE